MATPSRQDPEPRPPNDAGYSRVENQVGKGRPFAWWWIVVLVAIALIVWWGGWGRGSGPTTTQPANRGAAAAHGMGPQPGASAGQPSPKSGVTNQAANTPHNPR